MFFLIKTVLCMVNEAKRNTTLVLHSSSVAQKVTKLHLQTWFSPLENSRVDADLGIVADRRSVNTLGNQTWQLFTHLGPTGKIVPTSEVLGWSITVLPGTPGCGLWSSVTVTVCLHWGFDPMFCWSGTTLLLFFFRQ